jgi:hypothetical protein
MKKKIIVRVLNEEANKNSSDVKNCNIGRIEEEKEPSFEEMVREFLQDIVSNAEENFKKQDITPEEEDACDMEGEYRLAPKGCLLLALGEIGIDYPIAYELVEEVWSVFLKKLKNSDWGFVLTDK